MGHKILWLSEKQSKNKIIENYQGCLKGNPIFAGMGARLPGCINDHLYIVIMIMIVDAADGCSVDWGHGTLGAKYSYVVELRDTGRYGFTLPESQIIPTGQETYAGVMALLEYVKAHWSIWFPSSYDSWLIRSMKWNQGSWTLWTSKIHIPMSSLYANHLTFILDIEKLFFLFWNPNLVHIIIVMLDMLK